MSKWKEMKAEIRRNYRKALAVYELDYSHVFFRINNYVVYDVNDKEYYSPQSGLF